MACSKNLAINHGYLSEVRSVHIRVHVIREGNHVASDTYEERLRFGDIIPRFDPRSKAVTIMVAAALYNAMKNAPLKFAWTRDAWTIMVMLEESATRTAYDWQYLHDNPHVMERTSKFGGQINMVIRVHAKEVQYLSPEDIADMEDFAKYHPQPSKYLHNEPELQRYQFLHLATRSTVHEQLLNDVMCTNQDYDDRRKNAYFPITAHPIEPTPVRPQVSSQKHQPFLEPAGLRKGERRINTRYFLDPTIPINKRIDAIKLLPRQHKRKFLERAVHGTELAHERTDQIEQNRQANLARQMEAQKRRISEQSSEDKENVREAPPVPFPRMKVSMTYNEMKKAQQKADKLQAAARKAAQEAEAALKEAEGRKKQYNFVNSNAEPLPPPIKKKTPTLQDAANVLLTPTKQIAPPSGPPAKPQKTKSAPPLTAPPPPVPTALLVAPPVAAQSSEAQAPPPSPPHARSMPDLFTDDPPHQPSQEERMNECQLEKAVRDIGIREEDDLLAFDEPME